MEEGFIKYEKNKVVNLANIKWIGKLGNTIYFLYIGDHGDEDHIVYAEYENEWRQRFDLNDK
jgi:hypothetical protein